MDVHTLAAPIRFLDRAARLDAFATLVVSLAVLVASPAAHARSDRDADLIYDEFDNCSLVANGPNQNTNQVDSDLDGYGNRCDTDYDNSSTTTSIDFGHFLQCFGFGIPGAPPDCPETDHDGSGTITTADFGIFLGKFAAAPGAPGPSGLVCAGSDSAPCQAYFRRTYGAVDTPGLPNSVSSPTDYDVVTFQVPAGFPGEVLDFKMVVGAPGGLCGGGVQCYADGEYALAGWADLGEAEASPTAGTLFHYEVDGDAIQVDSAGTSNGGVPGNPSFPLSLLTVPPVLLGPTTCPATGCVVALIVDVSAAPGLVVETRTTSFTPPGTPVDHALCPVGCEGGLPVATAAIELSVSPTQ